MEGEEEGVPTAAIDSSKFFDMVVREVFTMMWKMGIPDQVWKLQASFVVHLQRFFRQGQSLGEMCRALNGVVQGCSFGIVTVACITGLWMDGMNQEVSEIKATTMVDDRRMYVVGAEKARTLEEAIGNIKHDEEVCDKFNNKKSTLATSLVS